MNKPPKYYNTGTRIGKILRTRFRLECSSQNAHLYRKNIVTEPEFDFEIVNFPFLDGDVPRSTSYGVYISQLIRFAIEHLAMLLTSTLAINC